MPKRLFLGEVDYFGEVVKAFREIYPHCWKFVIVTDTGKRLELATY